MKEKNECSRDAKIVLEQSLRMFGMKIGTQLRDTKMGYLLFLAINGAYKIGWTCEFVRCFAKLMLISLIQVPNFIKWMAELGTINLIVIAVFMLGKWPSTVTDRPPIDY